MMEKKYQLVAWTVNITDKEDARLHMIPSLECEVQAELVTDLTFIHMEEYKLDGPISLDLARRAVLAYEGMSRFEILTGHIGDGIRYLFFAAQYCIWEDDCNWVYYDTDLGSYSYYCGELRHEFIRLCEEGMHFAKKECTLRRNSGVKIYFRRRSQSGCLRCITSRTRRREIYIDI